MKGEMRSEDCEIRIELVSTRRWGDSNALQADQVQVRETLAS